MGDLGKAARDREIWEALLRGESEGELAMRYGLLREKIVHIRERGRACAQREEASSNVGDK